MVVVSTIIIVAIISTSACASSGVTIPDRITPTFDATSTMDIQTCNGFINQRLSILYGLVLAQKSNRSMYLPQLRLNGRQLVDVSVSLSNLVPFSLFYQVDHFVASISPHVHVFAKESDQQPTLHVTPHNWTVLWAQQANLSHEPVQVACPLFHLEADVVMQHIPLVNAWLHAFVPAARFQTILAAGRAHLQQGQYNFLHWRAEEDWMRHCLRWRHGREDDNCKTNTDTVAEYLIAKQVETSLPLYLATEVAKVDQVRLLHILQALEDKGYKVVTQQSLFNQEDLQGLEREERALLDYELALGAHKFVGNSVSTFSALLLWQRPGWSSYYNMGDIPMEYFLPFYRSSFP